ncbi:SusD/RagB family nutrient-binding outer membrane lipoprotein [Halosquirtibacter laminarini]|uniref:SusD/RagB family nutrient-binding outer membrane lipoprotein n=1 Tax=Halosquirtibacter laminarini TaxID=3374600 RepID=A0AC61NP70_9BACT|nr:SusD/RagB family nutrient-binding outer membrane lipoprotein [Prolixibacteraceae bacterium]
MKNTNYIKRLFKSLTACSIFALLLVGCTSQFEEYNTDPYGVSDDQLAYDNFKIGSFFPQLEQYVIANPANVDAYVYQLNHSLFGDVYSGYISTIGTWGGGTNSTTYNFDNNWIDTPFGTFVDIIGAWREIKKAVNNENSEVYALAQVLKISALIRLTDMYGPLPYTQLQEGVFAVPYDSQEVIYKSFFEELNSAISVMTKFVVANPQGRFSPKYDQVYQGNYTSWIKYANSLKLRLAMRINRVEPDLAKQYAEEAVNQEFGVIISNGDNAVLPVENNPLERITNGYNEIRMSANMESILNGYSDPRVAKYFKAGKSGDKEGYYGVRTSVRVTNSAIYEDFSRLNFEKSSPLIWLTAAEVSFLRAEGATLGWNMGGDAKTFYNDGITKSFQQWNCSGADAYIQNETATPINYSTEVVVGHNISTEITATVKWDESLSQTQKLEKIMTQRWIAMYPNGQEAWSEFRRTGYPKLFPPKDNRSNGKVSSEDQIKRIPFSHREYSTNADNIAKAITLLGGPDIGSTPLWWDVD